MKAKLWLIVIGIGVLGIIVFIGYALTRPDASQQAQNQTANEANLLGEKHANLGQKHIKNGEAHEAYNSNIPSSGPHNEQPADWGISASQLADETLIHNMEHGGVVIAYTPNLPSDQVNQLKKIFQNLPKESKFNKIKAVLVPRQGNEKPVQLAAWTYTYNMDGIDEAKIKQFYTDHVDKGPELVP
jgi:hypothetical protein